MLFKLLIFVFIAVTSIGVGGLPLFIASTILLIPRYNEIAATPSADFVATAPTPSIKYHVLQTYQDQ